MIMLTQFSLPHLYIPFQKARRMYFLSSGVKGLTDDDDDDG